MIIGLTGKNGSGKGCVADILKTSGFIYFSLSDVIRQQITDDGLEITRERLIETGNRLRSLGGPSVLADRVLAKLDPEKNYIIDSIRNPAEVHALRRREDFYLVEVRAPQDIRFERIRTRGRENDPVNMADFMRLEEVEAGGADQTRQQMNQTIALADVILDNAATLSHLEEKTRELVRELAKKKDRPGWDEYFMGIAKMVALRSNCIKRKVAAVIVKDKRVIATGYNGTPRGIKNCNDGGCPRCYAIGKSGESLGECLCSHAEENAIVQSAYHGVCIKDATLYTTFSPCLLCTKMIINSGITEVVFNASYPMAELPMNLLAQAYIRVRQVD